MEQAYTFGFLTALDPVTKKPSVVWRLTGDEGSELKIGRGLIIVTPEITGFNGLAAQDFISRQAQMFIDQTASQLVMVFFQPGVGGSPFVFGSLDQRLLDNRRFESWVEQANRLLKTIGPP